MRSNETLTSRFHARSLCTQRDSQVSGGGFSFPGPRKLSEIVKIQLLDKHGAMRVQEIWKEYHADHKSAVGDVFSAEEYELFKHRTARCKHFVLPVPRGNGFFTLLVQFQGNHCLLTFLDDYKRNPTEAQPYMTITIFEDMLETKRVALLRGEVVNVLNTKEAKKLVDLLKRFYLSRGRDYDMVVAFNENSSRFDFKSVLRTANIAT
ncbi:unnamed protein product [Agarophyton chilense]